MSHLRSQRGVVALDFIYGLVLITGGFAITLSIAFTLSVIEVGQYVAFSTSRAYLPTRFAIADQAQAAEEKFNQLMDEPGLRPLRKSDWFAFEFTGARNFRAEYSDALAAQRGSNMLDGTEIRIEAKILGFNIPFFGPTTSSGEGLSTAVNSILGREVSDEECLAFVQQRWEKIKRLRPADRAIPTGEYHAISDNGC